MTSVLSRRAPVAPHPEIRALPVIWRPDQDEEAWRWRALSRADRVAAVCTVVQDAMRRKSQVLAVQDGLLTIFCPHALAHRRGRRYILAFVLRAELDLMMEPFDSPARWRWIAADTLAWARPKPGRWHQTPPRDTRPALRNSRIDREAA